MKANELSEKELRIGNKILGIYIDDCENHIDERCTVLGLDSVGMAEYKIWVESENTVYEHYDYFEGIPLTEEWLVELGFTEHGQGSRRFYDGKFEYYIYCDKIGRSHFYSFNYQSGESHYIAEIQYVHQLQNLYFALKGEELKIVEPC